MAYKISKTHITIAGDQICIGNFEPMCLQRFASTSTIDEAAREKSVVVATFEDEDENAAYETFESLSASPCIRFDQDEHEVDIEGFRMVDTDGEVDLISFELDDLMLVAWSGLRFLERFEVVSAEKHDPDLGGRPWSFAYKGRTTEIPFMGSRGIDPESVDADARESAYLVLVTEYDETLGIDDFSNKHTALDMVGDESCELASALTRDEAMRWRSEYISSHPAGVSSPGMRFVRFETVDVYREVFDEDGDADYLDYLAADRTLSTFDRDDAEVVIDFFSQIDDQSAEFDHGFISVCPPRV